MFDSDAFYAISFSELAFDFQLPHVSPSLDVGAFDPEAFSTSAFDFAESMLLDTDLRFVRTTRRGRSF